MTKIVAFDFDGVIHKSVFYEKHGQGHPDNKCLISLKNNLNIDLSFNLTNNL